MIATARSVHAIPLLAALIALCLATVVFSMPAMAQEAEVKLGLKPVGVDGAHFKVTARPGETIQLTVELSNFGAIPMLTQTFAADAYTLSNGGFGVRLEGENQSGATNWITYPDETLTLQPGASETRSFPLTIPEDAEPGDYIIGLVIQNADPVPDAGGVAINRVVRQAMAISIDVPGPRTPALSISAARHEASGGSSVVTIDVNNSGNQNLKPTGEIVLSDATGNEVDRRQVTMDTFFAQTSTTIDLGFNRLLDAGDYSVSMILSDEKTGVTARLDQSPLSVPALEAPVVEAPDGSLTQPAPTNEPVTTATAEPSMLLVLSVAAGCLVLGVLLALGVMQLRARGRATPSAPVGMVDSSESPVTEPQDIRQSSRVKQLVPQSRVDQGQ